MTETTPNSLDILGVKPISDSIATVTKASADGASAFLSRICLPAAEELGLLFQDKVRSWRARNAISIALKAQNYVDKYYSDQKVFAHPRLVSIIMDNGSWTDDNTLQEMWAGLLSASCSTNGKDDSNLIFINLLSQITTLQLRIFIFACQNCEKHLTSAGLIMPAPALMVKIPDLIRIAETNDIHRIDRELDSLRAHNLALGGFTNEVSDIDLTPSALALNLYVRCQGYYGSAVDFFHLS
jgi:hypothetical protein